MATLYIKYAKKCEKMFFFPNYKLATPMLSSTSSKNYKYYDRNSVGIDIIIRFLKFLVF